jgi:hypothetical protein
MVQMHIERQNAENELHNVPRELFRGIRGREDGEPGGFGLLVNAETGGS